MFRTLTLAALLASGSLTATASAQPPAAFEHRDRDHDHDRDHHRSRYQVLVRHRSHWDVQGTYRDRDDAERVARRLEHRGLDARVERVQ